MDDREKKRQELLEELARRFRDSASTLREVARRINTAAKTHEDSRSRIETNGTGLRTHVESSNATIPFTYLEYIEFESAEEFERFRSAKKITKDEIKDVNLDDLCSQLLAS